MSDFSSIRSPHAGEAVSAGTLRDIVWAGVDEQNRFDRLTLPPDPPRGIRGRRGRSYLAPPAVPRLSLTAPALVTGGQVEHYRAVLSLLGDIELPAVGSALSPWYAIWCSSPRAEGGTPSGDLPPRNEGWRCTALTADTDYTLSLTAWRGTTAPRDVWMRDPADVAFLPLYLLHGGGGVETYAGLDAELTEGSPAAGSVSASRLNAVPLGTIRWAGGEPYYLPLLKMLSI